MEIRFIGQGLDPSSDQTAGKYLIDSFESKNYNSFNAFVAFVSTGGLNNIIDQMNTFLKDGGSIKLFVGVNLNATSKEALEQLLHLGIESYVVYSPNSIIYHPKIYAFEGKISKRAIIGSSNLTERGLFQNIEASVCVDFENDDENGNEFLSDIYDHFNSIIKHEHPSCQPLTKEVLEILVESKVVLPEAIIRDRTNKTNREFGKKGINEKKQLEELFGKVKIKRPPKGFIRTVVKKEMVTDDGSPNVKVIEETTDLTSGSMWIETVLMTGGSRNILDLSKKGKLDGVRKFGSVSYFGVDPDDENVTKDINISFGGKDYIGNQIFYAIGNQNWRIRLNGVTADGDKLTTFSIPTLGHNGGFQNKILVFTDIDGTNYRLEIIEQEEMQRLIENSSSGIIPVQLGEAIAPVPLQ